MAAYAFVPRNLLHMKSWIHAGITMITAMFMHGSLLHLLSNMLFLWIFGDNVEDKLGHFNYLIAYTVFGIFAGLCQAFIGVFSKIAIIGASGAIAGVMGAYFLFFPNARIRTIVLIFPVPLSAYLFLGLWFIYQVWYSLAGGPGVAWYAHIGGFLAGVYYAKKFVKRG